MEELEAFKRRVVREACELAMRYDRPDIAREFLSRIGLAENPTYAEITITVPVTNEVMGFADDLRQEMVIAFVVDSITHAIDSVSADKDPSDTLSEWLRHHVTSVDVREFHSAPF